MPQPFTPIISSDLDPEAPASSFIANALYQNPISIINGESGADRLPAGYVINSMLSAALQASLLGNNRVTNAHLQNSIVSRSKLRTATFTVSGTINTVGTNLNTRQLVHPGGSGESAYDLSMGPTITQRPSTVSQSDTWVEKNQAGYLLLARHRDASNTFTTFSATWSGRYITASPPYSLDGGENEIPWFIFAKIKDGQPVDIVIVQDPPWAHQGPTSIAPDGYFELEPNPNYDPENEESQPFLPAEGPLDHPYKLVSSVSRGDALAAIANPATRAEAIATIASRNYEKVLIDYDYKNSDIDLFPHPYIDDDDLGQVEVVMADYVSGVFADIDAGNGNKVNLIKEANAENIQALFDAGVIGFTRQTDRPAPPGVTLKILEFI